MNQDNAKKMWNSMAANFAEMEIPTAKNNLTLRLVSQYAMCQKGDTVLDVGCGAGRYAIALHQLGAEVTATDFSEEMIGFAKKCAAKHNAEAIQFSEDNWLTLDIRKRGWEKQFDFVLCSMTPAIQNRETVQKALDCCRGKILITKPCRRTNPVMDDLKNLLHLPESEHNSDAQLKLAFDMLWESGKNPQLLCEEQIWEHDRPLEKAVQHYCNSLENSYGTLSAEQKEKVREHLRSIAVDGIVTEKTDTAVYALFAKV